MVELPTVQDLVPFDDNHSPHIKDHFPFPEVRHNQELALGTVEKAYSLSKKFTVLELPTGSGKSGVGIAVGSHAKTIPASPLFHRGGYYLSPQKSLTGQLMADFSNRGLRELKGKANYFCDGFRYDNGEIMDCDTAGDLYEEHKDYCTGYAPAKAEFANGLLGTTNFAYYLMESTYVKQLEQRNCMILDECHGTENHILSLANMEVNRNRCEDVGIRYEEVPYYEPGHNDQVVDWMAMTFMPALTSAIVRYRADAETEKDEDKREAARLVKKAKALERFMMQIRLFVDAEDRQDWFSYSETDVPFCPECGVKFKMSTKRCFKCNNPVPLTPAKLIIKPLTATLFADEFLFSKAEHILMMSATILDFSTFLRNLGIDRSQAECLSVDSEFPVENRPIFYHGIANMSSKTITESLPKIAAEVARLLREYHDVKGIIHTHTYKISNYLKDYLWNEGLGERILTHSDKKGDRERVIAKHIETAGEPTVIMSPSMTEGLDLKDDLSRFSIICKVPYPYLSPYVKARTERDRDWYNWCTALAIQQATGRSNRHKDDKARHHILDKGFYSFFNRAEKMFSKYWVDALQVVR